MGRPFRRWMRPKVSRPVLLLQQLEERIVLDAAVNPVQDNNTANTTDNHTDTANTAAAAAVQAPADGNAGLAAPALPDSYDHVFGQQLNVVLISNSLTDAHAISDAAANNAQVIMYDGQHDNLATVVGKVESLAATLGAKVQNIAFVDHGTQSALTIGAEQLTFFNLEAHKSEFQTLGQFLADDAQIQFYDCSLAADVFGKSMVDRIAGYTGATAFASTDTTGGPSGNWVLEYSSTSAVAMNSLFAADGLAKVQSGLPNVAPILSLNSGAGSLDPTFGIDGKVVTDFSGDSNHLRDETAHSIAIQSDGKIVVAGTTELFGQMGDHDFALARYNTDGTLDTTFGTGGKVTTDFYGATNDLAYSVAIQLDGKIVVAGTSGNDFALARYDANGSLDTTFDGDGKLTTEIGAWAQGYSVVIQPDGKIVVAGASNDDFALARYNANGSFDTTFDFDGILTTDFGAGDVAYSVAIQPDGKIVAAGTASTAVAVACFNADGTLDWQSTDFINGKALGAFSVAIEPDGKSVVAGYTYDALTHNSDFALWRFNAAGWLVDRVITDVGSYNDVAYSVAIQPDGKIVAAGSSGGSFALVRYNSDCTLDTTFDADGKLTVSGLIDAAYSVVIQSDGKIISAGHTGGDFALARFDVSHLNYVENEGQQALDAGITLTDPDSATMDHATIQITGNYHSAEDVLAFANTASITGTWHADTGQLTLSGTDTVAHYQTALRSVTYENTSDNPDVGPRTVTWTVSDDHFAVSTPQAGTITITAVNDSPVANDDVAVVSKDGTVSVAPPGVLANDTDADNPVSALHSVLVTGPIKGLLTFGDDGSYTYNPNHEFDYLAPGDAENVTFTYKVNDGSADSNVATVTIQVLGGHEPPVAHDDGAVVSEDGSVSAAPPGVLANDTHAEGYTLHAMLVDGPSKGVLTLRDNGSYTYDANHEFEYLAAGATENVTFTYRANDGSADSNVATVTIQVRGVNDAPVAHDDAYSVDEDHPLTVAAAGVLANDTDVDSSTLHAVLVNGPLHGALTLNDDGSFSYTPAADYNGPDSFVYKANDGLLDSTNATVSITVNAVNDAPVAHDDFAVVSKGGTVSAAPPGVLANDTDVDGPALHPVLVSGPAKGILTLRDDGSYTYDPNHEFDYLATGDTENVTFTYKANDGIADSNVATVHIQVLGANYAPVAHDDAYSVNEDHPLTVAAAAGVLSNDTDIDSPTLHAVLVNGPSHGALTLNDNGSFTYTPAADYNGPDSFVYKANDGFSDSGSATVSITVNAVNDAPQIVTMSSDTQQVNAAGAVIFDAAHYSQISISDIDAGNAPVKVTLTATHGTVTLSGIAGLTFDPGRGDGTADATMTFTGTVASINTALTGMKFDHDSGYYGPADLTITVNDQGNTGTGGPLTATAVANISVEPYDVWFPGFGSEAGWEVYNYAPWGCSYYTHDHIVFWQHMDVGGTWNFFNGTEWLPTNGLGNAPYEGGYGPPNEWFHETSGEYSGYDVYIYTAGCSTYFSLDHTAAGATYWQFANGSHWMYYDGSSWKPTTGFNVEPANVWFHGYGPDSGWDTYNYTGGGCSYYTHDYNVYWQCIDYSGQWNYFNGAAWVPTAGRGVVA